MPFNPLDAINEWSCLRRAMRSSIASGFHRHEWAYLLEFLNPSNLQSPFRLSFGEPASLPSNILRPCGSVAVWLPNNVSLLGPLTLILLSLTGNSLRIKLGTRNDTGLAQFFFSFALSHLPPTAFRDWLAAHVAFLAFDRHDPQAQQLSKWAQVRIIFGSDQAATEIHALGSPGSVSISFTDRHSEAWLTPESLTTTTLSNLAKAFAVFGTAGCTSPRRAWIIGGTPQQTRQTISDLESLWPRLFPASPEPSAASSRFLTFQLARASGWNASLIPGHAVLAAGDPRTPVPPGDLLPIHAGTLDEALSMLPSNIQTIGFAGDPNMTSLWSQPLEQHGALRFVPLEKMHHFGVPWDGINFFEQCFTSREPS
jgi:hypothetical protein